MNAIEPSPEATTQNYGRVHGAVVSTSKWCAMIALALITVLMLAEVVLRYFAGSPLGWNVSFIEKVLLPGVVFLGMPWGYAAGAHVAADMVYDKLPTGMRAAARWLSFIIVLVGVAALFIGGLITMLEAFKHGDIPPPLSSQLPIYSWIWRLFLPVGSLFTAIIIVLESRTFLKGGVA
ncbi:TRAP transporter small permease [Brevibacterium marinum]|uniref:TRAP-type C4-dicarboxylate transport system permease small subunit n=1 Tax=Brevibacterium marinum TaxID=418643 RepID=A0A846S7W9_9MICO|nr:TRAP transporter small permease [Brevibacterium marinum]NJC58141.1 TRAP-type C4-dicarboxylate transport system permease small subunit [Brevibacterium marinum]